MLDLNIDFFFFFWNGGWTRASATKNSLCLCSVSISGTGSVNDGPAWGKKRPRCDPGYLKVAAGIAYFMVTADDDDDGVVP